MSWVYVGVAAVTVIGGVMKRNEEKGAAADAARAQEEGAWSGINEQNKQMELIQKLLGPYVEAGKGSLGAQQDLLGLNGPEAQQKAIDAIQNSPQFTALAQQGENAMMQSAAATGGLRGGNFQGAMAQFRPRMLSDLISQQYGRLGGITQLGQASAAQQAQQLQRLGETLSSQYGDIGAARAGEAMARGKANSGFIGTTTSAITGAIKGIF